MYEKSEELLNIERSFQSIKDKKDIQNSTSSIERSLFRLFNLNISLSVCNNKTNEFFGMTVYPESSIMDQLISNIMEDKKLSNRIYDTWTECKNWTIEVDSILLYDMNLNANPAEMTAVLLHEIGHVVYSNTVPARVEKVIKSELLNLDYKLRSLCTYSRAIKLFNLSIIEACSQKVFSMRSINKEYSADDFVKKKGYGDELRNFLEKVIKTKSSSDFIKSDEERDKEVEITVKWAISNISELRMRKTKLKHTLDVQIFKTPSSYIKNSLRDIRNVFIKSGNSIFRATAEQALFEHMDRISKESLLDFFDNIGKVKKIQKADIDVIEIEMNKIENEDDKIYMLDKVYDELEKTNIAIDLIESGRGSKVSQSMNTLEGFRKRLEKLRELILRTKVTKKTYGVFLKYPEGYEG